MSKEIIHICTRCGDEATKSNISSKFYISDSDFYKGNGRVPLCKKCLSELSLNLAGKFEPLKLKKILILMDKPYLENILEQAVESAKDKKTDKIIEENILGHYFRLIAMPQYRNMGFEDGDDLLTNEKFIDECSDEYRDMQEFWGHGFGKNDYLELTKTFNKYVAAYICDTPTMEELLKQAAFESLEIKNKRLTGQDASKNLKNLLDLLGSANIKPNQETGANANEQETFGTLIQKWENEKPVPSPLPEWMSGDWIRKYVVVWFFGHMAKMLGKTNPYEKEYEEEIAKYTVVRENNENDEDTENIEETEVGDLNG